MDFLDVLKFVATLGLVLSLIGGCAFVASRFNLLSNFARRTGTPRLSVLESLTLDAKHRLMIVANGDREHTLLLGPAGDLVVESRQVMPSDAAAPDGSRETPDDIIVPLIKESGA